MIKKIFCFICLLLIQHSFGQLDQNLRFDEEGNLLNSKNSGRPLNFMKLVASKVKGEEKDGKKEESEKSEKSSETIVGSFTNYLIKLKNYLFEFFSPTTKDSPDVSLVKLSLVKNYTIL